MAVPERNLSLVNQSSVPTLQFDETKLQVIKNTVAKGATNDEFQMFIHLCQRYSLDPFLKEIWFIKYGNSQDSPIIMTSRDGYLKIAQQNDNFEGLKSFVVREGDIFEIDAQTDAVIHKFGAKRGKIIGAWAAAYHKTRRPAVCFVEFEEYKKNSDVWKKYPSAMIQKVAEVFVLKRQFGISGLVTQEEMSIPKEEMPHTKSYRVDDTPLQTEPEIMSQEEPPQMDDVARKRYFLDMMNRIKTSAIVAGYAEDKVGQEIRKAGELILGKPEPKDWTCADCQMILDYFDEQLKF